MKKLEAIKLIRKELKKPLGENGADFTNWGLVRHLSEVFKLQDTAYRDMIFSKNKSGLLNDYLLSIRYWKKRNPKLT